MEFVYLILLGFITGIASSYFGIGGATIIIPVLYQLFPELNALTVIGSSLGVILLNSTYNSFLFYKNDTKLDKKVFTPLIPTLIFGALTGTSIAQQIDDLWLKRIFAFVLILVTVKALLFKLPKEDEYKDPPKTVIGLFIGFIVGLISGLTGLGGGVILAPTFLVIYKVRPKLVPAYNNLLMIVVSTTALMHYVLTPTTTNSLFPNFQIGQSNWAIVFIIFTGSLFTAKLGVKWNDRTSDQTKKYLFVAMLTVLAVNLLIKTF